MNFRIISNVTRNQRINSLRIEILRVNKQLIIWNSWTQLLGTFPSLNWSSKISEPRSETLYWHFSSCRSFVEFHRRVQERLNYKDKGVDKEGSWHHFCVQEFLWLYTVRITCILCLHLGACRFFTHPTALMHLQSILSKCIQLHFIFLAHTRMGSHSELL